MIPGRDNGAERQGIRSGIRPTCLRNGNPQYDLSILPRCGARTRAGTACQQPAMANGRCRLHGGRSTGPRTEAGKARQREAVTRHGLCSRELRLLFRAVRLLRQATRRMKQGDWPLPEHGTYGTWLLGGADWRGCWAPKPNRKGTKMYPAGVGPGTRPGARPEAATTGSTPGHTEPPRDLAREATQTSHSEPSARPARARPRRSDALPTPEPASATANQTHAATTRWYDNRQTGGASDPHAANTNPAGTHPAGTHPADIGRRQAEHGRRGYDGLRRGQDPRAKRNHDLMPAEKPTRPRRVRQTRQQDRRHRRQGPRQTDRWPVASNPPTRFPPHPRRNARDRGAGMARMVRAVRPGSALPPCRASPRATAARTAGLARFQPRA